MHAAMVHTDQRPPIRGERPYEYLDASSNYSQVAGLIRTRADGDGLLVIDGAGNRPHVDNWLAATVDLVLVPVTNSAEDVRCALNDLSRIASPKAYLVINRWPANRLVRIVMQRYVDQLPASRVIGTLPEVGALRHLLDDGGWHTPPTKVRSLARRLFRMVYRRLQATTDRVVVHDDEPIAIES
jgi:hypothetical protein